MSASCLPACLPACISACMSVCLLVFLSVWLSSFLYVSLPFLTSDVILPVSVSSLCVPIRLPSYLSFRQPVISFFSLLTIFPFLPSFRIYLPCLPFASSVFQLILLTHFSSDLPLYRVSPSRSAFLPFSLFHFALSSWLWTCFFRPCHTRCSLPIDVLLVTHTPRGALQISTNELPHLKFWGMSNVDLRETSSIINCFLCQHSGAKPPGVEQPHSLLVDLSSRYNSEDVQQKILLLIILNGESQFRQSARRQWRLLCAISKDSAVSQSVGQAGRQAVSKSVS